MAPLDLAYAQGILDFLFGGFQQRRSRSAMPTHRRPQKEWDGLHQLS
jgi:hypothetical protein